MYLELAEGENNGNYEALAENPSSNYIFIPGGFLPNFPSDQYVRADFFAQNFDPETANQLVNALASYQSTTMNEGAIEGALNFVPGVGPIASKALGLAKNLIKKRQEAVASGKAKPIGKPGGLLDKLKGKIMQPKTQMVQPMEPAMEPMEKNAPATPEAQPSFFKKYKTPLIIGGIGILAVGGIILATRKRKTRR
jgi:hypothetical protein